MSFPVIVLPEARAEMLELADSRDDSVEWFLRLNARVNALGDREPGHPILHEQADRSAPRVLRELLFPSGRPQVRVIFFRFDGVRVRVLPARHAAARPLTDREVRRLAGL